MTQIYQLLHPCMHIQPATKDFSQQVHLRATCKKMDLLWAKNKQSPGNWWQKAVLAKKEITNPSTSFSAGVGDSMRACGHSTSDHCFKHFVTYRGLWSQFYAFRWSCMLLISRLEERKSSSTQVTSFVLLCTNIDRLIGSSLLIFAWLLTCKLWMRVAMVHQACSFGL